MSYFNDNLPLLKHPYLDLLQIVLNVSSKNYPDLYRDVQDLTYIKIN